MKNLNWQNLGFKKNPFGIVPDKNSEDLIWAGFKDNKAKFDKILSSSLKENETRLVLVLSRYGGGKTHSSYFYNKCKNLPKLENDYPPPINLIVTTPKEGNYASQEFYVKLLDCLKISRLSATIKAFREKHSTPEESLVKLQKDCNSEDLGRILWLLGEDDDEISFIAEQTIYGNNLSSTAKTKLRIRRGINSNSDKAQLLSCIFLVLAYYDEDGELEEERKIFLWLDELESLIFYTSKQYRPFTQTVREIIDFCPKFLTLFMNFSFAEPDDVSNVEIVIGEALLDRVSDQIIIEEATIEESLKYLNELFKHYRIAGFTKNDFFPFNRESLVKIMEKGPVETGKPLMPRTINKWCLFALNEINEKINIEQLDSIDSKTIEGVSLEKSLF